MRLTRASITPLLRATTTAVVFTFALTTVAWAAPGEELRGATLRTKTAEETPDVKAGLEESLGKKVAKAAIVATAAAGLAAGGFFTGRATQPPAEPTAFVQTDPLVDLAGVSAMTDRRMRIVLGAMLPPTVKIQALDGMYAVGYFWGRFSESGAHGGMNGYIRTPGILIGEPLAPPVKIHAPRGEVTFDMAPRSFALIPGWIETQDRLILVYKTLAQAEKSPDMITTGSNFEQFEDVLDAPRSEEGTIQVNVKDDIQRALLILRVTSDGKLQVVQNKLPGAGLEEAPDTRMSRRQFFGRAAATVGAVVLQPATSVEGQAAASTPRIKGGKAVTFTEKELVLNLKQVPPELTQRLEQGTLRAVAYRVSEVSRGYSRYGVARADHVRATPDPALQVRRDGDTWQIQLQAQEKGILREAVRPGGYGYEYTLVALVDQAKLAEFDKAKGVDQDKLVNTAIRILPNGRATVGKNLGDPALYKSDAGLEEEQSPEQVLGRLPDLFWNVQQPMQIVLEGFLDSAPTMSGTPQELQPVMEALVRQLPSGARLRLEPSAQGLTLAVASVPVARTAEFWDRVPQHITTRTPGADVQAILREIRDYFFRLSDENLAVVTSYLLGDTDRGQARDQLEHQGTASLQAQQIVAVAAVLADERQALRIHATVAQIFEEESSRTGRGDWRTQQPQAQYTGTYGPDDETLEHPDKVTRPESRRLPPATGLEEGVQPYASVDGFLTSLVARGIQVTTPEGYAVLDRVRAADARDQWKVMDIPAVPAGVATTVRLYTEADWAPTVDAQASNWRLGTGDAITMFMAEPYTSPDQVRTPAVAIMTVGAEPIATLSTITLPSASDITYLTPSLVYSVAMNARLIGQAIPIMAVLAYTDEKGRDRFAIFV